MKNLLKNPNVRIILGLILGLLTGYCNINFLNQNLRNTYERPLFNYISLCMHLNLNIIKLIKCYELINLINLKFINYIFIF